MDLICGYGSESESDNESDCEKEVKEHRSVDAIADGHKQNDDEEEKELQHRDKRVKLNNGREKKKFNIALPTLNDDLTLDSSLLPPPPPSKHSFQGGLGYMEVETRTGRSDQQKRQPATTEKKPDQQQKNKESNKPNLLVPPQIWKKKPNITSIDA